MIPSTAAITLSITTTEDGTQTFIGIISVQFEGALWTKPEIVFDGAPTLAEALDKFSFLAVLTANRAKKEEQHGK